MADTNYEELFDSDVIDVDGNKIGSIGQVYLDDQTGQPSWVTVKTGWFGLKETFVPLERAVVGNGQIKVPFTESKVKEAPRVDPDKHLDADEEAQLYEYYGFTTVTAPEPTSAEAPVTETPVEVPPAAETPVAEAEAPVVPQVAPEIPSEPVVAEAEDVALTHAVEQTDDDLPLGAPAVGNPETHYGLDDEAWKAERARDADGFVTEAEAHIPGAGAPEPTTVTETDEPGPEDGTVQQ